MATSDKRERDFSQPWDLGDVTFVVEDKKIHANKSVLIMSSDVFKAMLTTDFAEKQMQEIPLVDKKFRDFIQLMELHPPAKRIDGTNVYAVLPLAHEYQIDRIVEECHKVLTDATASLKHLNIATMYNLVALEEKAIRYAAEKSYAALECENGFDQIDKKDIFEILRVKAIKSVGHVERRECPCCGQLFRGENPMSCRTCYFMKVCFDSYIYHYQGVRYTHRLN